MTPSPYCILPNTQVKPDDLTGTDTVYKVTFPGHGDVSRPLICGKVTGWSSCPNKCGPPVPLNYSCKNILCPVCYHEAVHQMAKRIEDRIIGMGNAYRDGGTVLGTVKQIVWSVNPDLYPISYFEGDRGKRFRNECIRVMRQYSRDGVFGGTMITHLYRKKHLDGSECGRKKCGKKHSWEYGPHIHYIGYGYFVNSDIVHDRTGWVYKNIKPGQKRDVFDTAYYLLTHSAIFTDTVLNGDVMTIGMSYTWVGQLAYSKGGRKEITKEYEVQKCPVCGDSIHKYQMDLSGKIDYDYDMGEMVRKNEVMRWYVNLTKRKRTYQAKLTVTPA